MKVCNIVFRCGTAFDKVQIRALFNNDQCMLKLSCTGRIQSEIGLQWNLHMHTCRNIYERTAGPDRAVQCRKLMVSGRNQLHEMAVHQIGIFSCQRAFHIRVYNALCCNLFAHVVINQLRIVLCADARQGSTLCIRDAQCFKRIFDIGRNLGPFRTHLRVGAYIGNNLVHI